MFHKNTSSTTNRFEGNFQETKYVKRFGGAFQNHTKIVTMRWEKLVKNHFIGSLSNKSKYYKDG